MTGSHLKPTDSPLQTEALPLYSGPLAAGAEAQTNPTVTLPRTRLSALDAWRGLTVLLMILVNNVALGEFTPEQLSHAHFGGVTLADMVFPWFLFCAGAALPFSRAAMLKAGVTGEAMHRRLLTRAVLLYLMGALVTSATLHAPTLGLGVMQLIALATLGAALLGGLRQRHQAAVAAALLLGYGAFLQFGTYAGGTGLVSETVNPVQALNATVLSPLGLRGLLSVIPTTALVLFGSLAAAPLQQKDPHAPKRLLGLGVTLTALGCGWAALGMPYSKTLWTPSYILLTAGLGTLGILAFWWLADSGRVGSGPKLLAPLTIPGRNALAAYVLPILIKVWILQDWKVSWTGQSQPITDAVLGLFRAAWGPVGGGWAYTLGYVALVWLGLAWMARKNMIWKL